MIPRAGFVIPWDKLVVEYVVTSDPVRGVVGLLRACLPKPRRRQVLQQNARLQLRPVVLPNPGEFEFGFIHLAEESCSIRQMAVA